MAAVKKQIKTTVQPAKDEPLENAFCPLVDIYEQSDGTTIMLAEMPGALPDSVDIHVDKGVLTIAAQCSREPFPESYARVFTSFEIGEYFRAFALSDEVDRDKIEAKLEDGLLKLSLPKAAAVQKRKIEIK